ncbi:MAG TPA: CapA family protein [Clostridia bacterium]|nr:CapA family protein [Clostridia bacterium]
MKKIAALVAIIIMLIIFGCSAADVEQGSEQSVQDNVEDGTFRETVQQEKEQEELVLSFVGDIMFDKSVAGFIKSKGEDYVFQGYEKHFKSSDIVFGNLETSLSNNGKPMEDKEYTFRSSPKLAPFLKKYNFYVMSIANNHVLDYGRTAFTDTMKTLKDNDISYGGGGYNKKEATEGVVIEKKGMKIGFIAFTGVVPNVDWYAGTKRSGIIGAYKVHEAEVLQAVNDLRSKCDLLVVSLHWGKEGATIVRKQESELAHKLVDAGVDVVMGHHPHVVQPFELYKDKLILYSLGNFIFTTSYSEICNKTVMATVRFDMSGKLKSVEAVPGMVKWGRPAPMEETQGREFLDYLNKMNINIKL